MQRLVVDARAGESGQADGRIGRVSDEPMRMSFTDFGLKNLSGKVPANLVGLDNYTDILQSKLNIPNFEFLRLLFFNLFWAFSNVIIHVVLGVAIALLLNTKGLRFRGFYRAMFILPVIIPPIIVATVWRHIFDQDNGAVNMAMTCAFWPVQPTHDPGVIRADGAPPILVVGTTNDPATPYLWAQNLAKELASGVLLTRRGEGHTGYAFSTCIQQHGWPRPLRGAA